MNGILLIDKGMDWTSNDVVSKLKGMLRERRIGHSGTLDPMATGLLVVFVGRATRAVEFAEGHDKRYLASLRLGIATDTQDITGTVLERSDKAVGREELEQVLHSFKGEIQQIPPMYSAIKINGQRLYDIARKGGQIERKARTITIHDISIVRRENGDWLLDVCCSKGTYIRTLCDDIGRALGSFGCMSALRRIEAGEYGVDKAYTLSQIQEYVDAGRAEELLMPVDSMFAYASSTFVNSAEEKKIRCGNAVRSQLPAGDYRVYSAAGEFLMLGRVEKGMMKTVKSFFEV